MLQYFSEPSTSQFQPQSGNNQNHRQPAKSCLLVHDSFHSNFNRAKFSHHYDLVEQFYITTQTASKNIAHLAAEVKQKVYDMIFVHVGHQDLWNGKSVNEVAGFQKQLALDIIEQMLKYVYR